MRILENEYDFSKTQMFTKKYLSVSTENCADQLAQFIISLV